MSYRIRVNEIDRSQTLIPNINNVGAMVVRSERGPTDPVFISATQRQRILDLFGEPNVTNSDVWEALEFNQVAPLYMVSTSDVVNDKYTGLLVQANMIDSEDPEEDQFSGATKEELDNFTFAGNHQYFLLHTKFPCAEDFLRAEVTYNNQLDIFNIALQIKREDVYELYDEYKVSLVKGAIGDFGTEIYIETILENNELIGVKVNPDYKITGDDFDIEDESIGVGDGSTLEFEHTVAHPNIGPGSIKIFMDGVEVASDDDVSEFGAIEGAGVNGSVNYVTGEMIIEFDEAPAGSLPITINYTYNDGNGFMRVDDPIMLTGSLKTTDHNDFLASAWNKFQQKSKYPAKIFMDTTADDQIPALFNTLRNSFQHYSSYILALPVNDDWEQAIDTKNDYGLNNRGLAFYWNRGLVRYGNSRFYTPLIGRVGMKYAAMVNVYNGLAPSWKDENGHGGQLGPGVLEMRFDPTEDALRAMDEAGINPIAMDPTFGVMIMSQKTAMTPGFISDDSYIGHSRLFDIIIENIRNQILIPQITKLNDEIHRRRAVSMADIFMRPMIDPSLGLLNDYIIKCDTSNNDEVARSQKKFVFTLAVQVTPFSEFIEFNFIKVGQAITVQNVVS